MLSFCGSFCLRTRSRFRSASGDEGARAHATETDSCFIGPSVIEQWRAMKTMPSSVTPEIVLSFPSEPCRNFSTNGVRDHRGFAAEPSLSIAPKDLAGRLNPSAQATGISGRPEAVRCFTNDAVPPAFTALRRFPRLEGFDSWAVQTMKCRFAGFFDLFLMTTVERATSLGRTDLVSSTESCAHRNSCVKPAGFQILDLNCGVSSLPS